MPELKKQVFRGAIREVTFGPEGHRLSFGGEATYPFYSFDKVEPHRRIVGLEVLDTDPEFLEKCAGYDALEYVDFICLHLAGGDPNNENKSTEELLKLVENAAGRIKNKPIAVAGCDNTEKDAELLPACARALTGYGILLLSAKEENLEAFKKSAPEVILGAESSVDINLAKQLDVLAVQAGIPEDHIVINAGNAACGYGFEYLVSTMERIRAAALSQDDKMLQMPVVTLIGPDSWGTKEAQAGEEDMPGWGDRLERGRKMEIMSAVGVLAAGSDAVIVRDPVSASAIFALETKLGADG